MQIVKDSFSAKIVGKCLTDLDIWTLFNFGFSKDNVIKKYKKDNKLKTEEATRIVEEVLLKKILQERSE